MSAIRERQLPPASPKILVIRQAHPALTALLVNAARNAQLHRVTSSTRCQRIWHRFSQPCPPRSGSTPSTSADPTF